MDTIQIEVSPEELRLLLQALDSHRYWQLSDEQYRSNGEVLEPGSDERETVEQIAACEALAEKLQAQTCPAHALDAPEDLFPRLVRELEGEEPGNG